ncbi:MAG: AraC family transcriptional regulator, partial [Bacteroidetes bacterium]
MKVLPQFDGLYGDLSHRHQGSYLFSELIETRSKGFGWVIQPHFHRHLYQVFVVETGEIRMESPMPGLHLQAPCIMYFPPSVLHGFAYSPDVTGRILTLSGNWVEGFFEKLPQVALVMGSFRQMSFSPGQEALFMRIQ